MKLTFRRGLIIGGSLIFGTLGLGGLELLLDTGVIHHGILPMGVSGMVVILFSGLGGKQE